MDFNERAKLYGKVRILVVKLDTLVTGSSLAEARVFHGKGRDLVSDFRNRRVVLSDEKTIIRYGGCSHSLSIGWDASPMAELKFKKAGVTRTAIINVLSQLI